MRLKSRIDFFIKEDRRVYFTAKGADKFKNIKITGTKIYTFFEKSPYRVWSEMYGFYTKNPKKPKRKIEK